MDLRCLMLSRNFFPSSIYYDDRIHLIPAESQNGARGGENFFFFWWRARPAFLDQLEIYQLNEGKIGFLFVWVSHVFRRQKNRENTTIR